MLNGVMLLWFLLTAMAVAFVAIDIRSTPESPVLKWGFVLLTAYTGPIGAFLYVRWAVRRRAQDDLPYQSENDNSGGVLPLPRPISLPA